MTKERKIYWHHPEFFLGAEEELEEVGAQPTCKICSWGSFLDYFAQVVLLFHLQLSWQFALEQLLLKMVLFWQSVSASASCQFIVY